MAECRFCSRKLNANENHPTVNDEIKSYFTNITQINLLDYEMCSKVVCELCLRTLQLANALRAQLLDNEQRLYDLISKDGEIVEPESPIQSFEPHFQYTLEPPPLAKIPITKTSKNLKTNEQEDFLVEVKTEKDDEHLIKEENYQESNSMSDDQQLYFPFNSEDSVTQEDMKSTNQVELIKVKKKLGNIRVRKSLGTIPEQEPPVKKRKWTNACRGSEKVFFKNSATNSFDCLYCSFITDSQHVIKQHLITAHQTEIPNYKCPHCDSTYFKGSNLKRHILSKHMNQRFMCSFTSCTIMFRERSALRRHMLAHHAGLKSHEMEEMIKQAKVVSVDAP